MRFEVDAPVRPRVLECNCSICSMTAHQHLIVPGERFRLLSGEEQLSSYTFGTHTAQHLFCSVCGIKSFYRPRSQPGGVSVNLRCLDAGSVEAVEFEPFDGRNWEEAAEGPR